MEQENHANRIPAELAAFLNVHPVETPRLALRPFRQSDLADLYEYLSQKEQQRLAGNCPCDSTDDAKLCLEYNMSTDHPQVYYAIVLKAENKVIGNITFNPSHLEQDETLNALRGVTLSYILNERYWRRGLMTELLRAVYALLFNQAKLDYIQSGYLDFNAASAALHRKLGMKLWIEDEFDIDGQHVRAEEMILFRDEYLAGKNPQKTK